jgi:uncharacterized protein (TIGR02246 family)
MRVPLLVIAAALAAGPASAQSLKASIDAQNAKWLKAFSSGDAKAVAQLYMPNAVALPSGAPMATGRAAIQEFWQGAMKAGVKNVSLQTLSVQGYGRVAREIGRFALDEPGANGTTDHVEGKYVVLWQRTRDGWMLNTDIWNMDK